MSAPGAWQGHRAAAGAASTGRAHVSHPCRGCQSRGLRPAQRPSPQGGGGGARLGAHRTQRTLSEGSIRLLPLKYAHIFFVSLGRVTWLVPSSCRRRAHTRAQRRRGENCGAGDCGRSTPRRLALRSDHASTACKRRCGHVRRAPMRLGRTRQGPMCRRSKADQAQACVRPVCRVCGLTPRGARLSRPPSAPDSRPRAPSRS